MPVTVVSGQDLVVSTVVGRIDKGCGYDCCSAAIPATGQWPAQWANIADKAGCLHSNCVTAATNGGTFSVISPDGHRLQDAIVGTAYTGAHLTGVTVNDGSTDYAVGDSFTVTIATSGGKWKAFNAANTDGSEILWGRIAHDCDANDADTLGSVYLSGEFNSAAVTGATASAKLKLQEFGIIVRSANNASAHYYLLVRWPIWSTTLNPRRNSYWTWCLRITNNITRILLIFLYFEGKQRLAKPSRRTSPAGVVIKDGKNQDDEIASLPRKNALDGCCCAAELSSKDGGIYRDKSQMEAHKLELAENLQILKDRMRTSTEPWPKPPGR